MNKKLVIPFITWLMFLVLDISALIKGIELHQSWRIATAGAALIIATAFLVTIARHTTKELKAVRVRVRK